MAHLFMIHSPKVAAQFRSCFRHFRCLLREVENAFYYIGKHQRVSSDLF